MKRKSLIIISFFIILGLMVACSSTENETPNLFSTVTISPTMVAEVTVSPTSTQTATMMSTATKTQQPTSTSEPTATKFPYYGGEPYPTAIPFAPDDIHIQDLLNSDYHLLFGSSIPGADGFTYSAYIFIDASFPEPTPQSAAENLFPRTPHREILWLEENTEGCRVVFYRSDGETNEFIASFGAPEYPEGSRYHNPPADCLPNDWFYPAISLAYTPGRDESELLGLDGVWSDINQNGLPEFGVHYQYCSDACLDKGAIATHLYEFQTSASVVDITADLPGVFEAFPLIHSQEPLDFYVFDPTLWYCYKWCIIDTWWIYAWDGEQFVDVSPKYADEYIAQGAEVIASIQEKYGTSFRDSELLTVLFLYEKAGLRDQAIDIFLELTDPSNWPNASSDELCWLQIVRATAKDDYDNGRAFTMPEIRLEGAMADIRQQFQNGFEPVFDIAKYDISACDEFIP